MTTFIRAKDVVIQKPHRCFACFRTFHPPTKMERQTNAGDSGIFDLYSCVTCQTIMNEFPDFVFDEGERIFPELCVREAMQEFESVSSPEELLNKLRE